MSVGLLFFSFLEIEDWDLWGLRLYLLSTVKVLHRFSAILALDSIQQLSAAVDCHFVLSFPAWVSAAFE